MSSDFVVFFVAGGSFAAHPEVRDAVTKTATANSK